MSPNAILIFLAAVLAVLGLLAQMIDGDAESPRLRAAVRWILLHGETIIYTAVFVLALGVLGPALDRHDAARAAAVAEARK
jgi:hypothetical protein